MNPFELLVGLVICLVALIIYFLPALIASSRGHRNRMAIWALNLFLGWTLLGWVASLAWSLTAQDRSAGA